MTIYDSLASANTFPIPSNTIEKICIDRGLDMEIEYSLVISTSQAYELALADLYVWLAMTPNVAEQEVSISNAEKVKDSLLRKADQIYGKWGDEKFSGMSYGFIGEDYNG
jgi:hypothetical protein